MEPKIISRDEIKLVGMQYIGSDISEISKMWCSFIQRTAEIKGRVNEKVCYGIGECTCEGECKCGQGADFSYIAGVEVDSFDQLPAGMITRTLPASKYAVFTHKGPLSALSTTYENVFTKWIPASGLQPDANFAFEYYDERFNANSDNSEVDIYVPVK